MSEFDISHLSGFRKKKNIAEQVVSYLEEAINTQRRTEIWLWSRSISTARKVVNGVLYYWFMDGSSYIVTMEYILMDKLAESVK